MGPTIRTRTPCPTRAVAHAAGRVARGPEVDGSPNSEIEPRIPGRLVGDLLLTAIVTKPSEAVSHQWADSFAATVPPYLRLDVYDEWLYRSALAAICRQSQTAVSGLGLAAAGISSLRAWPPNRSGIGLRFAKRIARLEGSVDARAERPEVFEAPAGRSRVSRCGPIGDD
jgi:hypothetical protein